MIREKKKLTGNLNVKQSLSGSLSNSVVYVNPITQEKEATPTKQVQEIVPDSGFTGLSKVIVNPYTIVVDSKKITKNGKYKSSDDNLDGYSEVEVETSGVDINDWWETSGSYKKLYQYIKKIPLIHIGNIPNMYGWFYDYSSLITIPQLNTSETTNMNSMFYNCKLLETIPQLDTSNVTGMNQMFYACNSLTTVPKLNANKLIDVSNVFDYCSSLTDFGGFQNLGMAYNTTQSANYKDYTLTLYNCSMLSHDSLVNVLNNLYDIATKGCNAQQLILGSTNLKKLTAEEIAIATNKGWTVS